MKTITLEIKEDGAIYDKNGVWVALQGTLVGYESNKDTTLELVNLGLSADEIIKLKHQGLL